MYSGDELQDLNSSLWGCSITVEIKKKNKRTGIKFWRDLLKGVDVEGNIAWAQQEQLRIRENIGSKVTFGRIHDSGYKAYLESMNADKLSQMTPLDRFVTQFDMFATGYGPREVHFGDNTPPVNALKATAASESALRLFYNKNKSSFAAMRDGNVDVSFQPLTEHRGYWGIWNVGSNRPGIFDTKGLSAMMTLNAEEHFIGSWNIDKVSMSQDFSHVIVEGSNATSYSSFTPWFADSYSTKGPLSNYKQTYSWKVDLDYFNQFKRQK